MNRNAPGLFSRDFARAPWYSYGIHNDWPRHVTLPALVVLCYFCAQTLVRGWGDYQAWYRRIALAIGSRDAGYWAHCAPTLSHLSRAFENRELRVFRHEQLATGLLYISSGRTNLSQSIRSACFHLATPALAGRWAEFNS